MKTVKETASVIIQEVERAEKQWGSDFDAKNTLNDWCTYINIYLGKAATMGVSSEEIVKNLRKAAGLALSALRYAEAGKLAPRHYEYVPKVTSLPEIDSDKGIG